MTDHLVSPERAVTIGGKTYPLDCSFRTLKAIQHAFEKDILDVLTGVKDMRFDEHARLIQIGIGEGGPTLEEIEQAIVDDIGIAAVRWEVQAWLAIAVTPKRDREKKAKEVTELLERLRGSVASLGETTSSSPSASSAGSPKRSGKATSGN